MTNVNNPSNAIEALDKIEYDGRYTFVTDIEPHLFETIRTTLQWQLIETLKDCEDKEIFVYNKDWSLRTRQTATLENGKIWSIGCYFAHDIDPPTHWARLLPEPFIEETIK